MEKAPILLVFVADHYLHIPLSFASLTYPMASPVGQA
jgi:hypothetical protein